MALAANSRAIDAVKAWELGLFDSKRAYAATFEISKQMLDRRLNGAHSRSENGGNGHKFNDSLEEAVCGWIIRSGKFNMAPILKLVRDTANFVLRTNNSKTQTDVLTIIVGKNWPTRFVKRLLRTEASREGCHGTLPLCPPTTLHGLLTTARSEQSNGMLMTARGEQR